MSNVHRSPSNSSDRVIGQYWPYRAMPSMVTGAVQNQNWMGRAGVRIVAA